ncbi:MAG: hypothetical protein V3T10_02170 [Candidatus Bathyarchaeia archaeon]
MARRTPKPKKVKNGKVEVEGEVVVFDRFFSERERDRLQDRLTRITAQKAEFEEEILNVTDEVASWDAVIAQLP